MLVWMLLVYILAAITFLFWDLWFSRERKLGKDKSDYFFGGYLYDKNLHLFIKVLIPLVKSIVLVSIGTIIIYLLHFIGFLN
ncbi:MAG: hypothetical protein DWP97_04445 [Calditrichaeota bacterium]|nr:MAG: hypothetical protein DWP97_04445 [Calditrichota bacterium]